MHPAHAVQGKNIKGVAVEKEMVQTGILRIEDV